MKKLLFMSLILFCGLGMQAQSEMELIRATLMDYIEGTADGDADRIRRAFHKDLNLYVVEGDTLRERSGQQYISYFEDGKKRNRIGNIVSIDHENDAAMAKIRVDMPGSKRLYTDYLLLLKIAGEWKIIHKSYTYVPYPN
ncbi:MAG: nuclear transport factor 2 family protein [Saprospiraceae bacterium]|nr:nuclear transport factor 2 family protein [Saprospiraceae bacterium]